MFSNIIFIVYGFILISDLYLITLLPKGDIKDRALIVILITASITPVLNVILFGVLLNELYESIKEEGG